MINTNLYVRNYQDCYKIPVNTKFNIYELLGKNNGNSDDLSVALEEFAPLGSSPSHYHGKAEEYQFVFEGEGKLVIGNETRIVKKGDFVKISPGMQHQTFNEHAEETLKLWCFLTPSWTAEDSFFEEKSLMDDCSEIYMRRKKDCLEIDPGHGEKIYELLGKENGASDNLSIAIVEIEESCASEAHIHPEAEEAYIVLEGQGRLVVDGETRIISQNELAKIPKGKEHQIFNNAQETLKFLCVCAPAWTPDCFIKV